MLPIGGLKAKSLAAHRGGVKQILVPKENEKDIPDIPKAVREALQITIVSHLDEVLKQALILDVSKGLFRQASPKEASKQADDDMVMSSIQPREPAGPM